MHTQVLRRRDVAFGILVALGLSACGGGGGGGGNVRPSPPPSTPTAPPAPTPQPPLDSQLALTHTYAAHHQGYTGAGVTIGIVDSGVMRNHPSLTGRVSQELIYLDPEANDTAVDDVVGHGTWVSQIAAGEPVGDFPGGIAPGATLVSARIIADEEPDDDGTGQGNEVGASDADFFGQYLNPDLIAAGVRIQNNSWGGIYWDTDDDSINQAFAQAYDDFVINHDGLVVFAAGNEAAADPSDIAALPNLAPQLERGWLVAVAADSISADAGETKLADYSNACGKAKDYCLTAPGDVIVTDKDYPTGNPKEDYWIVGGTSFAAPQVSGAAALVWQAYPYFNNDLVRQTLLGTADDLGTPGPDSVFGYGMLNVGKAVNGPAKFDWGDVTVDFDDITSTWGNEISGAGGLTKTGTGTLVLHGHARYTGLTTVAEGTLKTDNGIDGPAVVAAGATLVPFVFGPSYLENNGTVVIQKKMTLIQGDYVQGATGRLSVELGTHLGVTGHATLNGGSLYVNGVTDGYVISAHTDVLTAGGGLTGTFASLDTAANVFLDATLEYDANNAWLNVQQVNVTAVTGMSYTAASSGAAERVQGAFDQLNVRLGTGATAGSAAVASGFVTGAASLQRTPTLTAAERSLESLSGQLHAASAAMTFEAIDAGTRALSDRFDLLLDSNATGGWAQNLGYHGGMVRNGYADVGVDLSGTLVGQDMRIGSNGVAGFALAQSRGLGRLAESADQGRSHAVEGMLYGGLVRGNSYLMGRVGMGNYRETMRRHLQLGPAFAGVASDSRGRYEVAYGESGYHATLGRLTLTPYANLQYARIGNSGFDEAGAWGFGLKTDARTIERWQAGLGLRAARHWNLAGGGSLDLQGHLAWQHAFAVRGEVFEASFTGIDQWAPLGGIGLSRYGGVAGMTLDWAMTPRAGLSFGVDHRFAQREQGSMATLAYRLSF
ncbi:S8 family serine peptidase [Frateuria hangzhouensis]|uniref:S8 family serine peptidase n=1 Tax=Frateuria hangzhouensis TaxID=2995589 RepID=UPI002260CC5D|nr:autotransporter serine protease [Frateuria sp. STR12]MCX7513456.1 S8 family serine peptidase [Frateuria sp. STR12]